MLQTRYGPFGATDPLEGMRRIQGDMNRFFDTLDAPRRATAHPLVNVWAGSDSVVMTTELPGLSEDDIELTVRDTMLTIRGAFPDTEMGEGIAWHRRERPRGRFSRSVELPFRIDADRVDARFENGVLTVEMQRPEAEKPKRIAIKA